MTCYKLPKILLFQIVLWNYCSCSYAKLNDGIKILEDAIFNPDGIKNKEVYPNVAIKKDWDHSDLKREDFKKLKLLGSGQNGKVFQLGKNYVLKVLEQNVKIIEEQKKILSKLNDDKKKNLPSSGSTPSGDDDKGTTTKEVKVFQNVLENSISVFLMNLDLDFFCKYYAVLETPEYTYVILERVQGVIFKDSLKTKNRFPKNKKSILKFFRHLLYIVGKLHENDIVHMDLKSDNFMTTGGNDFLLKLIDLGAGFYNGKNTSDHSSQNNFKILYPRGAVRNFSKDYAEALLRNNGRLEKQGLTNDWDVCKKYDIWCCGCILYEMIFGKEPFHKFSCRNIWDFITSFGSKFKYIKKVYNNRLKFDLSDYSKVTKLKKQHSTKIFYTLLSSTLTKNDSDRKSIAELLRIIDAELGKKAS